MAEPLTDHQIRLLKVCDHVRWGENYMLDGFKYHMVRRAVGQKDPIIEFELKAAIAHMEALGGAQWCVENPDKLDPPELGTVERSPWRETYGITKQRYDEAGQVDTPMNPVT